MSDVTYFKARNAEYKSMSKAALVELKESGDRKASAELNRRKKNRPFKNAKRALAVAAQQAEQATA